MKSFKRFYIDQTGKKTYLECDIIYNDEEVDEVWIECEECKKMGSYKVHRSGT